MEPTGFIGLGLMGGPMALNLVRSGRPIVVWNRTASKTDELAAAGATVVDSPGEVFERCPVVLLMLADSAAVDAVLDPPGGPQPRLEGRIVVNLGTLAPAASERLQRRVAAAGGHYVEAPVSGSRVPAQRGELVIMLAGDSQPIARVAPLLAPLSRQTVVCGAVPSALRMKLAVNLYLVTMVAALAETLHFAGRAGLDLQALTSVLDAGPMASSVSRMKLAKVLAGDYSAQAAATDVAYNCDLIADEAEQSAIHTPLLDLARGLYTDCVGLGHGADDMIAVLRAIEARDQPVRAGTAASSSGPSSRPTTVSGVTDR